MQSHHHHFWLYLFILETGTWRISFRKVQEASGMGDNNNSTMLHSLEAATVPFDTSNSSSDKQYEPDEHGLAISSKVSSWSFAAFEDNISSMESELKCLSLINIFSNDLNLCSVINFGRCLTKQLEIEWERKSPPAFSLKTEKLLMLKGD